jgi:hypothetical protein
MTVVEEQVTSGATITLDDKHFVNCQFSDCKLLYNGGDYALTDTRFDKCEVSLTGPALRTAMLMTMFGMAQPAKPNVQQVGFIQ